MTQTKAASAGSKQKSRRPSTRVKASRSGQGNPEEGNWVKTAVILFALGATLGVIGDWFHVRTNTTGYPAEKYALYIAGLPYWVFLLFGSAAVAVGLGHPVADRFFPKSARQRPGLRSPALIVAGLFAFVFLYSLSGYLPKPAGGVADLILAAAAVGVWWALDRTWQGVVFAATTAILGTVVEVTLVSNGIFFYQPMTSNLLGVASWLPWLYVVVSVAVGNLGRYLLRRTA